MLRDFGFGTPTGGEFPGESRGILAFPHRWQPMYTRASIAMGYEFAVTPVQLAAAYAAIANDGVLLAPTLVREVRGPGGQAPLPPPARAGAAGGVLGDRRATAGVPARGRGRGRHGREAQLANYSVLGKTGTAIRFENGRYVRGQYTASFAAIFPGRPPAAGGDRQDRQSAGATTTVASPPRRSPGTMLQQALASRRVAIDRGRLAARDTGSARGDQDAWPRRQPARRRSW